ncbi:MAG TPA: sugar ABC transporter permease [Sphaerochaeta sp.]|nr:sugar ABC transporter permease [Sphaerochaeta sp.]
MLRSTELQKQQQITSKLLFRHETILFIIMIVFGVVVNSINPAFLKVENLFDILKTSSITGMMALGVMVVMISGGMDISFTAIATVSMGVTVRMLIAVDKGNIVVAFLVAGIIGALLGCINGFLVYRFKLPTLIVTLGTSSIFHGLLLSILKIPYLYTVPGYYSDFSRLSLFTFTTADGAVVGFSYLTVLLFVMACVVWLILRFTMVGRGIYAIGGSIEAAKRAGFNILFIQLFIYSFIGFVSGVASIEYVVMFRHVHPFNMMNMMLNVIAAVVLGGTSINGGTGTVLGTLFGVWMIYMITNSLILMGIPSEWESVVIGFILILSIGVNAYQKSLRKVEVKIIES